MRSGFGGDLPLGLAAHRGDDMRTGAPCQLDRRVADRTGAAVHQHGLAVERTIREEAAVCREIRNTECRSLVDADAVGDGHRLPRGDDGELRRRAVLALEGSVIDPHALADAADVDAGSHGLDDAGPVLARHLHIKVHGSCVGSGLPVRGVNRRDLQSHAHLADTGSGRGDLVDREDVGVAPLRVVGRQHGASLVGATAL